VLAVLMIAGIAVGSIWATDDAWPFAPFRMYATATRLDGVVLKAGFSARTTDGRRIDIPASWMGLRPAEIEGQMGLRSKKLPPARLAALAAAWNRDHPAADQIVRLELVLRGRRLHDGRPGERVARVVQVWESER
jgi:hypothetical protein